jgi:CubicO group peptidase (beta-lactamase class C family)
MPDRIAADIADLFAEFDRPDAPGATVGVWRAGEEVACLSFGSASIEHRVPNRRETVFYLASTSKQFVACSVAMLVADGLLDLDDEVRRHVPEVANLEPAPLVRHLVHHTSGIRDEYALADVGQLADEFVSTDGGMLELLSRQRTLNFEPGSQFLYSNSGYYLMAQIVERVSGERFGDFVRRRIFEPLGMSHSQFRHDTSVVVANRASGYRRTADGDWHIAEYLQDSVGPGGLISTVDDLSLWSAALMSDGLAPPLTARLLEREPLTDGSASDYAFGLSVTDEGGVRVVRHAGGVPGFSAEMIHVFDERLTIVCLANSPAVNAPDKAQRILELLVPATAGGASAARDGDAAPPRVGSYLSSDESLVVRIERAGAAWSLELFGMASPLAPDGADWRLPDGRTVRFDARGLELFPARGPGAPQRFDAIEPPASPDPSELVGQYRSAELDVPIAVDARADGLSFAWPRGIAGDATWLAEDLLGVHLVTRAGESQLVVRVVRGDGREVTGLAVSTGRGVGTLFRRR